jgi:hypothetical protein
MWIGHFRFDTAWALERKFSQFRLFLDKALPLKIKALLFRYALYCFGSGQRDQIGCDLRQSHVASKRSLSIPRTAMSHIVQKSQKKNKIKHGVIDLHELVFSDRATQKCLLMDRQ